MMNRTIYLDYNIARIQNLIVDREQFIKRYDIEDKYKLTQGAPILVNVEGTYVKEQDLLNICEPYCKMMLCRWLLELKFPNNNNRRGLDLKWKR